MICARCDEPILRDEPRETHDILSPTGPGTTITVHLRPCRPSQPRQTGPSGFGV